MAIIWIDVETTGLEPEIDYVLEVGAIATDNQLNELGYRHFLCLPLPVDQIRGAMSATVEEMHENSGLLAELEIMPSETDYLVLDSELHEWVAQSEIPPVLGGNSPHFDRAMMKQWFPKTLEALHYRNLDESSISAAFKAASPTVYEAAPAKGAPHRSMGDLHGCLERMRYWYRHLRLLGEEASPSASLG